MEYTPEILIVCLLYIGLMNWIYKREYNAHKENKKDTKGLDGAGE